MIFMNLQSMMFFAGVKYSTGIHTTVLTGMPGKCAFLVRIIIGIMNCIQATQPSNLRIEAVTLVATAFFQISNTILFLNTF